MTTTIEAKANRLLADGKVFIRWSCSCEARVTCSHLTAVMRVTVPTNEEATP